MKANECFREALSIDINHLQSLMLLGCLCAQLGDAAASRTFLASAVIAAASQPAVLALTHILVAVITER